MLPKLSSYSLNDFMLYSGETWLAFLTSFVDQYLYLTVLPLIFLVILRLAFDTRQQLKRQLYFIVLLTLLIPLLTFYQSHYSQGQTFYLWYSGLTVIQVTLCLYMAFRFMQVKGMALFTIRDLLPEKHTLNLIILSLILLQLTLFTTLQTWQAILFVPATLWWLMALIILFSSPPLRLWLLPVPLLMSVVEVITIALMDISFVWLYLILPVFIFINTRLNSSTVLN